MATWYYNKLVIEDAGRETLKAIMRYFKDKPTKTDRFPYRATSIWYAPKYFLGEAFGIDRSDNVLYFCTRHKVFMPNLDTYIADEIICNISKVFPDVSFRFEAVDEHCWYFVGGYLKAGVPKTHERKFGAKDALKLYYEFLPEYDTRRNPSRYMRYRKLNK